MIDFLRNTGDIVTDPLVDLWISFLKLVPALVAAIVVLIIGYVIAYLAGNALRVILQKASLDKQLARARVSQTIGSLKMSSLIGEVVKWYVFIIFLQSAVDLLNLGTISNLLTSFVFWLPNVIAAILVLVFGVIIAHLIYLKIRENVSVKGGKVIGHAVRVVVIFISVIIALEQIKIDVSILKFSFLILLGGLALGFALAIGLSFGLGTKSEAKKNLSKLKKYL